jgi:sugar lactone lactonase YvrE
LAALPALLAPLFAGCGGGAETCAAGGGDGALVIVIAGHDTGAVTIEGVPGTTTTSGAVTTSAGTHQITAGRVSEAQAGITSLVYEGTVDQPNACVRAGERTVVAVTYAPVPTSGKLWVGIGNGPGEASMLGFAPASVASTRTSAADVVANTGGSDGFTFDRDGNMWVLGGTTADPPLARYPAAAFASDGVKIPDVTIDSPSFGSATPGPKVVAFDPSGNLWVSVVAENKVVMFTAAQLAAGGSPTATVERMELPAPQGLAFDSLGNLWVAAYDADAVIRIDAADLTTSGPGGDLTITAQTPPPNREPLTTPISLAFDALGDLWVNYFGTLANISVAEQRGTGAVTITPGVQITTDVLTLPVGIAFDQDGGLWFAHAVSKFARLAPAQLQLSGATTPDLVVTSPDVGSAAWFALYPAPAFTPLYHRFP